MSPSTHKSWLVLNETLPAVTGQSLLGTIVADVQLPTNRYEPRSKGLPANRHPLLEPSDVLTPYVEDRTITAGSSSGRSFEIGLCAFISGNKSSSKTRQAQITSTCITTYRLGSPDDVFKKLRNDSKHWAQVESLMLNSDSKKLYFVTGYKTATDPVITLSSSNQPSYGFELTAPVITAATGGVTLPAGIMLGDPRFAIGMNKGDTAAQHGLVKGERLFAIQYWAMVKKRVPATEQIPRRRRYQWGRRIEGVAARPPAGNNIMFSGGDSKESEDEDSDEEEDDFESDDDEEDQEEWGIVEYDVNALI